jgi:hypothetical protein
MSSCLAVNEQAQHDDDNDSQQRRRASPENGGACRLTGGKQETTGHRADN